MKRVLVVGCSGSGKSTLAKRLSVTLQLPYIELDALFHGPNWTSNTNFVHDVTQATAAPCWIVDGNYLAVRDLLWTRADTIVWIDLPRWLTEYQVIKRSFVRWIDRAELWNGNREAGPLRWLTMDHPVRWSWAKYHSYQKEYGNRFIDSRWKHATRVRLKSRAEVERFIAQKR